MSSVENQFKDVNQSNKRKGLIYQEIFKKIFKKAKEIIIIFFSRMEIIALLSMTAYLLTLFYTEQLLGDGHDVFDFLVPRLWLDFTIIYLLPSVISLIIVAVLALSLRKIVGFFIAVPYLLTIGLSLFQILFITLDSHGSWIFPGSIRFILKSASLVIIPPILIVALWNINRAKKIKIYQAALVIQVVLAAGSLYYHAYYPKVQHLGIPVVVRQVRLGGDGALSLPFIEGNNAYFVNSVGRIFKVSLDTGQKEFIARISYPSPAEAGLPDSYFFLPDPYNISFLMTRGVFSRISPSKLSYQYPYTLYKEYSFQYLVDNVKTTGYDRRPTFLQFMNVIINEESGHVSWHLEERLESELAMPLRHFGYADIKIFYYEQRIYIEGRGIQTVINPAGRKWTLAESGWFLAGTDRGVLYIIDAGLR